MKLNFVTFAAAVRVHLSPTIATALPAAAVAALGSEPEEIEDSQAGALILRALLGTAVPALELTSLHAPLMLPLDLPAPDALAHPAFAPWLAETLVDAVTRPIIAGARVMNLAPNAPEFGPIELVSFEGEVIAGTAALDFAHGDGALRIVAKFGKTTGEYRVLRNAYLSGSALIDVGIAARARPEPRIPTPPDPPTGLGFSPGQLVAGSRTVQ